MTPLDAQVLGLDVQGLGDAKAEETEETGQGVVDDAARAALGDEGTQLHADQAEGGRLGVDLGPADVLGRGGLDGSVDDREAVEAGNGGQLTADGGRARPRSSMVRAYSSMWPRLAAKTSRLCWAHQEKYWRRSLA